MPPSSPSKRFFRNNGLSLALMLFFFLCVAGQSVAGWLDYNEEARVYGEPEVGYLAYFGTGHFWEAIGENWESEFLQMAAFMILTACLFQKGSPESKDPDSPDPEAPVTARSPYPMRRGGWMRRVYEHSLSIALLLLFVISFVIHAIGGHSEFNAERLRHGQSAESIWGYVGSSKFWFESLQNWQSEFLSIAVMVVLAVYLRQKGSPESKDPATPHEENE
jgi:hypothetical protein